MLTRLLQTRMAARTTVNATCFFMAHTQSLKHKQSFPYYLPIAHLSVNHSLASFTAIGLCEHPVESIFGPVMQITKFQSMDEVIQRANFSEYGLAAGIVTRDLERAMHAMQRLRAGTVWINCYDVFDAAAPFGGYKWSGVGRELGEYGLEAYTEKKT
ncbi:unnamed protein product, partial [Dicrocoelium dendriticum]